MRTAVVRCVFYSAASSMSRVPSVTTFVIVFVVSAVHMKICPPIDVRNDIRNLNKLANCTTIAGDLRIVLLESITSPSEFENYRFPNLTEVTGYLMIYHVPFLTSIGIILPNLRVVRGSTDLIQRSSIIIFDNKHLEQIGLTKLLYVQEGVVTIGKNPLLCFEDTVNWKALGTHLVNYGSLRDNFTCPGCLEYCEHCWNGETCQEYNTEKCHTECLGCKKHYSAKHCNVCKNFNNAGECVSSCPPNKFKNKIKSSCLTKQECLEIDVGKWWTFSDECVNTCPEKYEIKDGGCVYCGENCNKICNSSGLIEDVSQDYRGCTYLNGSLEIKINGYYDYEDLSVNLGSLRVIEGFVKIYRSNAVTSLNFLKDLREIRGSTLENGRYAIFMFENQNLRKLWNFNDKFNLTIKNGLISFHNNPQLCLSEIQKLANVTGLTGKYEVTDVSPQSNGNMARCNITNVNSSVININSRNVTIVWEPYKSSNAVGYIVYYTVAANENNSFEVTCGISYWNTFFTSDTSIFIELLAPYTKYAYFIKILQPEWNAQSEIKYFQTETSDPEIEQVYIKAIAHNSTTINVTWPYPKSINGIFAYYQIMVFHEPDYQDFISQRNYCKYTFITNSASSVGKPQQQTTKDDKCECNVTDELQVHTLDKQNTTFENEVHNAYVAYYEYSTIPTNSSLLKAENQIKSDLIEENQPVVYHITNVSQTSYLVTNLKHFRIYVFYVQACNQNRTERQQCSGVYQAHARTLRDPNADNVNIYKIKEDGYYANIFWSEPIDPNSITVAYNIEYINLDKKHQGPITKCITRYQYHPTEGYRLKLDSGSHEIRVRAVSLAGPGNFSPKKMFYISYPEIGMWQYVLYAAVILLVIIGVIVYLRYKNRRLFDNIRLITNINPDYAGVNTERDEWEIDRENVVMDEMIGEGTFGAVYTGFLKDRNCPCAIKTVKDQVSMHDQMQFLNEASVMKSFSNAHHVVKLYGVVSIGHPKLVVMELMGRGDLKRYLRSCRNSSSNNITSTEMYKMAIEIADGMAYLAAKKYVHRDLAVRNCMVADDYTVKIGDFGMTRDIYQSDYYRKETRGLLPVRWMAPESLVDGVFTSDSDVWSYGIVLWEIATLAEQPYQGLSNEQVYSFVSSGGKLDRPQYCPDGLYDIMSSCWHWRPMRRPQFLDIIEILLPRVGPNFALVSFYHSRDGYDYRLNHRQRAENPPAIMQGTRMHYRVNDDNVNLLY